MRFVLNLTNKITNFILHSPHPLVENTIVCVWYLWIEALYCKFDGVVVDDGFQFCHACGQLLDLCLLVEVLFEEGSFFFVQEMKIALHFLEILEAHFEVNLIWDKSNRAYKIEVKYWQNNLNGNIKEYSFSKFYLGVIGFYIFTFLINKTDDRS